MGLPLLYYIRANMRILSPSRRKLFDRHRNDMYDRLRYPKKLNGTKPGIPDVATSRPGLSVTYCVRLYLPSF